ncbi:hypothetical protein BDQ17DRAFT_1433877 [Cyathus striatus]|nr:hypothetical protein BDQ17DRAFT_1433877 [Cyathus striatus]
MSSIISAALMLLALAILYASSNPTPQILSTSHTPQSKGHIPNPKSPRHTKIKSMVHLHFMEEAIWKSHIPTSSRTEYLGTTLPQRCNSALRKRSRIYSNRPQFPAVDMMGWDFNSADLNTPTNGESTINYTNSSFIPH